jgi:hypothetical protein
MSPLLGKRLLSHACQQGGEKMTEDAVEDMLDKVVKLLAYISDKDMFAEFYRKRLSRRLLNDKSASDDHERAVLTRLKQQCGAQFTSKVGAQRLLSYAAHAECPAPVALACRCPAHTLPFVAASG